MRLIALVLFSFLVFVKLGKVWSAYSCVHHFFKTFQKYASDITNGLLHIHLCISYGVGHEFRSYCKFSLIVLLFETINLVFIRYE